MRQWTEKEEQKLRQMRREGRTYKEIAEALGRTQTAVAQKINSWKKKEKERIPKNIYKEKIFSTNERQKKPPSKDEIYDKLVLALLTEFDTLRSQLSNLPPRYVKIKPRLYTNLFRCTEALLRILKAKPAENDIDDWAEIIAEKLPSHMAEPRKLLKQWTPKRKKL